MIHFNINFIFFFFCKVYDWLNVLFLIANRSSRKAWLLATTLVILFPFSLSTYKKREEWKENELAKVMIKGHAFLLDLANDLTWFNILFDTNKLGNEVKTKLWYTGCLRKPIMFYLSYQCSARAFRSIFCPTKKKWILAI